MALTTLRFVNALVPQTMVALSTRRSYEESCEAGNMGEIYPIEEADWCAKLHQDLYAMMTEKRFCDTEILTGDGETLQAHASILAARSTLLKNTFSVSSSPSFRLNTEHIPSSLWKILLHFMYLGNADVDDVSLRELFHAAEILEMPALQDLCKHHLDKLEAHRIVEKQSNMSSMESQTEEEILKFASGERSTLYGYDGNGEADTSPGLVAANGYRVTERASARLRSAASPTELILPGMEAEALYVDEADVSEKAYVAIAAPIEQGDEGNRTHETAISITKVRQSSKNEIITRSNRTTSMKRKSSESRVLQRDMLFKCGICNKFYSSKQGLERHAFLHTSRRGFTCELCGKSFKVERYLQAHVERHNDERNFQCPICGKSFKTQRDATWHQKTVHTSDRKFHCPHCNYAGKTKNLLNQHMFSHTNAKQFVCQTCGKTFLRKQHLMQHTERHEGKRNFMCSTCGAEFYTIYACKEHHMRIHQGLKKYECSVCGQQYNEKKSFMKHLQKHSVDLILKLEGDIVVEQTIEQEPVVGGGGGGEGGEYPDVGTSVSVDNVSSDAHYSMVQYHHDEDAAQDVQLHYVQDNSVVEAHYIGNAVGN